MISIEDIGPDLQHLALIAISFPKFTDGRAYSQARLIRGRLGFTGQLRATGDVLFDQLQLMTRCGFDFLRHRRSGDHQASGIGTRA